MIHLDLQPEIDAQLAAEARARGLALGQYVEKIAQSRPLVEVDTQASLHSVAEAVARIRKLREETSLGGHSIRGLINEDRKY